MFLMKRYVPVLKSKWTFKNLLEVDVDVRQFAREGIYIQKKLYFNVF